jgi:exonuclease III
MDMRFGTWNVRSLYRIGSLKIVARELGKCKVDLVGVQEVRQKIIHFSRERGVGIIS